MEQETADELVGVERHHLRLVVLTVIAPQEADPGLRYRNRRLANLPCELTLFCALAFAF
jgi:hypothetical protein